MGLSDNYHKKNLKLNYSNENNLAVKTDYNLNNTLSSKGIKGEDFSLFEVKPGLCMYTVSVNPQETPGYNFEIEDSPLQFAFCLSGRMKTSYNNSTGLSHNEFTNKRGVNSVCRMSDIKGRTDLLSGEILKSVAIQVDEEVLDAYFYNDKKGVPLKLKKLINGDYSIFLSPMTMEMQKTAMEIFTPGFTGAAGRLYMEGKVLELLGLQVNELVNEKKEGCKFSGKDRELIFFAGEILRDKIQEPPTIVSLARMVGINEFKLKKGFKEVFGTTVHQYLQNHRMSIARDLIINKGINVSETAYLVGYVNISHFINCYKKTFGTTPGDHKNRCSV